MLEEVCIQLRKDNHYVPQLYLKQWTVEGKIPTYRLLVPSDEIPLWKDHSLRGIAYHRHLYTYQVGQSETDEFERWLGEEFEAPAEEAIRLAVNDRRMSRDQWITLIRYAVAQDVRTPENLRAFLSRNVETMQALLKDSLAKSVDELEAAIRAGVKLPQVDPNLINPFPLKVSIKKSIEGVSGIEAKTVVGRRLWLWSIRRLLSETIKKITTNHWTVVHAPAGVLWPTSDNPLVRLNYHSNEKYDFGGGWGAPNVDILMPLSPTHLLHNCIGRRSWSRGSVLDGDTAQFVRRVIIEHADRYIFDVERSDIHSIRPRVVSVDAYMQDLATWKNWGKAQSEAEAKLFG